MTNPSDNPHGKSLIIDDPEADLPRFGRRLRSVIDDGVMNILPKPGRNGFHRTLKYTDWAVQPEIFIR